MKKVNIAIAGNPNCGKTTLFNALTGSRHKVGNWPGVTVERLEGDYTDGDQQVHVTDLPGIYSFSAYSMDETVAREHILNARPEVVVNILDATNLERNLFLTTQLLEMQVPMVVALSMVDVARKRRIKIELAHLERHLGCPVVPITVAKGTGLQELKEKIREVAESSAISKTVVHYDSEMEKAVDSVAERVAEDARKRGVNARWLALKVLEQDEVAGELVADADLQAFVASETHRVEQHVGEDLDIVVADGRYGFIHGLTNDVVHRDSEIRRTVSDRIDKVLLNRVLGIPVFLFVMYLVFVITINVGGPFIEFFDQFCGTIFVDGFGVLLETLRVPAWLVAFLAGGIGDGIKTVSTFIPPIFLIFFCLSFLEDSGYMARAAFVMDRFLRTVGLPGKAFIPMLVGFGCNVPAIMATRTLENDRDRLLTITMNPFMSCGARLPVYAIFVAAFFRDSGGSVLFAIYMTGIVLAILTGLLFKRTILRGEVSSFVMELPPYHLPTFRGIMFHTWHRLKGFILRAGAVILVAVVVLGLLNSIRTDGSISRESNRDSVLSAVGKGITPAFYPMGLTQENWPGTVGLFSGLFAKEAVVGTLNTLYAQMEVVNATSGDDAQGEAFDFWAGIGEAFASIPAGFADLADQLKDPLGIRGQMADARDDSTALGIDEDSLDVMTRVFDGKVGAFAYMLFILIYAPCVAAIGAIYRETGMKWTALTVGYLTALAWIVSTLFYQLGTYSRHPASSAGWIAFCAAAVLAIYMALRLKARGLQSA